MLSHTPPRQCPSSPAAAELRSVEFTLCRQTGGWLTGREQDSYYITLCRAPSPSLFSSPPLRPVLEYCRIYTFIPNPHTRSFRDLLCCCPILFVHYPTKQNMATATASSPSSSAGAPSTPALQVNGSPPTTENSGKRAELRMTMLKKLRPYPLRHEWVFWHDRSVELMRNRGS